MSTFSVSPTASTRRVARYDTIVIGAGQAGLAVGHSLMMRGADFLIVDSASRVGDSWRNRWDSLRLLTPASCSGLPGMPFPAAPSHLPDKDEVAHYLERYAERFDLPIQLNSRIESLKWNGRRYVARIGDVAYEANNVVVTTGPFHHPRIPSIATELSASIHQIHSSQYRSPFGLAQGPLLVVGAGNSGSQLALELSRFHQVTLAGRSTGYILQRVLGRDTYKWLWPLLRRGSSTNAFARLLDNRMQRATPVVGISQRRLLAAGVNRVGRVNAVEQGMPVCDGVPIDATTIVWATGFSSDYSWIKLALRIDRGTPVTRQGVVAEFQGLYFVGLRHQRRFASSLLGGVGDDAAYVVDHLLANGERV